MRSDFTDLVKALGVGGKAYLNPQGNNKSREIKKVYIKSIGRKYFEVWDGQNKYSRVKFHLDSLREVSEYMPYWAFHFTDVEILENREATSLKNKIGLHFGTFSRNNLTLDQLRRIHAILEEPTEE